MRPDAAPGHQVVAVIILMFVITIVVIVIVVAIIIIIINSTIAAIINYHRSNPIKMNIAMALIIVSCQSQMQKQTKNKVHYKRYDAVNILTLPNDHLVYDHVTMRIPVSHDHFEQMEPALQKSFVLGANELVDGNLSKRRRN